MIDSAFQHIILRVPGFWGTPEALARSLPGRCALRGDLLTLPDGSCFALRVIEPNDGFRTDFAGWCDPPLSRRQSNLVATCTSLAGIGGRGGSLADARRIHSAAAALLHAGGLGVFVEQSTRVVPPDEWLKLAEIPHPSGMIESFTSLNRNEREAWTAGMQVFGLRDVVVRRWGDEASEALCLLKFLWYLAAPGAPIDDGAIWGDCAHSFSVTGAGCRFEPDSHAHNPYGRWILDRLE